MLGVGWLVSQQRFGANCWEKWLGEEIATSMIMNHHPNNETKWQDSRFLWVGEGESLPPPLSSFWRDGKSPEMSLV